MRYRHLLFILFTFVSITFRAQKLTQFSTDTMKFTKDLSIYFFDNSANKEQASDYIRNFEKLWKDNVIAGNFKEIIMTTSNTMLGRRMKPYPFFYSYLNTVVNAIKSGKIGDTYDNWQTCVDKILAGKSNRGIQEFLDMSENIFKNNVFYSTPSYDYYSLEPNFTFVYDSIPRVLFESITLIGANPRGDSIAIEETGGTYYPTNGKFVGRGGKVSWERCGLDNEVYATIKRYTIDCKTGNYTSDSATFTGKQFFDKPQTGKLLDRVITENGEKTYPRFDSYSRRLIVKDIYPDIDYDGGFGMRRGPRSRLGAV